MVKSKYDDLITEINDKANTPKTVLQNEIEIEKMYNNMKKTLVLSGNVLLVSYMLTFFYSIVLLFRQQYIIAIIEFLLSIWLLITFVESYKFRTMMHVTRELDKQIKKQLQELKNKLENETENQSVNTKKSN